MTSFVRPIAISLLCAMAALGHAPAWLHVAGCDHEKQQLASGASVSEVDDFHPGCCHHSLQNADRSDEHESSEKPGHSHDGHESESCVICQSLAVPNGVAWKLDLLSIVLRDCDFAKIPAIVAPESTSLSIPQPRGPPAPLA